MRNLIPIAIALALISLAGAFAYFRLNSEIQPIPSRPVDHMAVLHPWELNFSQNVLILRGPETLVWQSGETGSFALALRNRFQEARTFYISVYPESSPDQGWLLYPSKISIPGNESKTLGIFIQPVQASPGNYLYRIAVCQSRECSLQSTSLYATTTFSFRIS